MALPFAAGERLPVIDGDVGLPIDSGTDVLPEAIEAIAPLQTSSNAPLQNQSSYDTHNGMSLPMIEGYDELPCSCALPTESSGFVHQPLAVAEDELWCGLPTLAEEDDHHSQYVLSRLDCPSISPCKRARRHCEVGSSHSIWDRSHLRTDTLNDLPQISAKYGADLLNLDPPPDWCDRAKCKALLKSSSVAFAILPWFLLEIFAGCAQLTEVAKSFGLAVGPPVDIDPAIGGGMSYNLLVPECRKLVWALIVLGCPRWVHVGFPCTFWSLMAHFTRRHDPDMDESTRLQNLVFIIFARQVGRWQHQHGRHFSFENPPRCRSWSLDVVVEMVNAYSMKVVDFDCCMYGAVDPGNGLFYKKAMRIAMTLPLDQLAVRCDKCHAHQTVQGAVDSGPRRGTRRSKVSGEYTTMLCKRWIAIVQADIVAQS